MKSKELEKLIQNLSTDLYSFAYILIPDDLQATQLMIDSVSVFFIQKKSLVEKWKNSPHDEDTKISDELKFHLYKAIYDLSRKRYQQLKMSFKEVEDNSGFFSLDLDEKASLYLREKSHFNNNIIEFILGKSRSELLAHLYSARLKLAEKFPANKAVIHNEIRNQN